MSRTTTLRALVISLDPDWVRDSRIVREYEFSRRVFIADYQRRGAYHDPAPEEGEDDE